MATSVTFDTTAPSVPQRGGLEVTRIPFARVQIFDPKEDNSALQERFEKHLMFIRKLKALTPTKCYPFDESGEINLLHDEGAKPELAGPNPLVSAEAVELTHRDKRRIARRVSRLLQKRSATTGLARLSKDDQTRLSVLRDGAELRQLPNEHRADEIAAMLHTEFPWLAPATIAVWDGIRKSVRDGSPGLSFPPLLLDGPPGIGKSVFARRVAELVGLPALTYEATGESASFGLVGAQRGWSNAQPGRVITTILQTLVANPIVIIDEIEKAGVVTSGRGRTFSLPDSLLPLLEPATARAWNCPYYEVTFDMSWISWILTSNTWRDLPDPLLSRCPPIQLQDIEPQQILDFARKRGAANCLSPESTEAVVMAICRTLAAGHRVSLRDVNRMIVRAETLERKALQH